MARKDGSGESSEEGAGEIDYSQYQLYGEPFEFILSYQFFVWWWYEWELKCLLVYSTLQKLLDFASNEAYSDKPWNHYSPYTD